MKKIIVSALVAVAAAFGCNTASAQAHYTSRIYVGAHGGANFSEVSFTPSIKQKFTVGGNAGLNFRYVEEKHFGFILEVNWEQRGWEEDFEELPYSYKRTINYIQIPFMSHIYFGNRGKFFVNLGPSVSFKISDSMNANFDVNTVEGNPEFKNRTVAQLSLPIKQKVDYGISGGLGGEFSVTPRHSFYVEARFYYGLGNVVESGRSKPIRGANNMTINATIGYWFRAK